MPRTSITLLESLQKRCSPEIWQRFVRIYYPIFLRWAKKLNVPVAYAEDVIQELFIKIHAKIALFQYDATRSFRSWLKTLMRNLLIDKLRKKTLPTVSGYELDNFPDKLNEDFWQNEFSVELLKQALNSVRKEFTDLSFHSFEKTVLLGKPVKEIAKEMGCSIFSVYSSRARILKRLREIVGDMLD